MPWWNGAVRIVILFSNLEANLLEILAGAVKPMSVCVRKMQSTSLLHSTQSIGDIIERYSVRRPGCSWLAVCRLIGSVTNTMSTEAAGATPLPTCKDTPS